MALTFYLHYISIFLEVLISLIGLMLVFTEHRKFGWGIFLTFAIYVFYDFAKFVPLSISDEVLNIVFFVATLIMFMAVMSIAMEGVKYGGKKVVNVKKPSEKVKKVVKKVKKAKKK